MRCFMMHAGVLWDTYASQPYSSVHSTSYEAALFPLRSGAGDTRDHSKGKTEHGSASYLSNMSLTTVSHHGCAVKICILGVGL